MAHENLKKVEKLLDLGHNMSIWRVHLDALREQDKNARVMPLEKFERLSSNIGKDKRLESLPLVTPHVNQGGNQEFLIISGHHRTRAARSAGMTEIPVLVLEEELTHDQIRAKQLAHNALAGYDNPEILAELYREIADIDEKLASGLTDLDIELEAPNISSEDIQVDFDFELLQILFLPKQVEKMERIMDIVEPEAKLYLASYEDFERMKVSIQEVSKRQNVRNIGGILARMLDIVEKYHKDTPIVVEPEAKKKDKKKKDE